MQPRFLDPSVLASVAKLDLIAKTVVDGFVAGLHRSPDFGFSQEFAEYRMYNPGDDLRHVDWNVYARSERMYLKRFRGETNTLLTVLVDASNSMSFGSPGKVSKIDYARYAAASLFYLANQQRDAAGLVVFDDEVRNYIQPSSRQGQFHKLLHGVEHAEPRQRTDYAKPFHHLMEFLRRRGMVVVFSDFYEDPATIIRAIEPLRYRGNDVILFHVLDPRELDPKISDPVILVDLETQDSLEVSPDYAGREYRSRIQAHMEALREKAKGSGMDYYLMDTGKPLDGALREYMGVRQGRL